MSSLMSRNALNSMDAQFLIDVTNSPPQTTFCSVKVSVCVRVTFRLGLGFLHVYVSSRIIVRRTLHDLYFARASGRFVTLIEV